MKRRAFIALSISAAAWLLNGCGTNGNPDNGNNGTNAGGGSEIGTTSAPLPIPQLFKGEVRNGVRHFDLSIDKAAHSFFSGVATATYAVNSTYLGPTLLLTNGEEVSINYTNNIGEETTMHGHGMHLPAIMDGGPHQMIDPGKTWSARYRVSQKACTNWYHPHLMGKTAEHVYKGLAGLIIVQDDESRALDLPDRYGEDDIPLVLQDRRFDSDGQILYAPTRMEIMRGYIGDTYITNGAIDPFIELEAKEIRLRILNGSNASVYKLGFDDGRRFHQIATDNAFLEAPVALTRLRLSPGERAEIVVDLSGDKGKTLLLKDYRRGKTFLELRVTKDAVTQTTLPATLTNLTRFDPQNARNTRTFRLSGMMGRLLINGVEMNMNVINERVPLDQVEIWEVHNNMGIEHNFHIHATHFMVLERNGSVANVAENEKGYKDVIYLAPHDTLRVIVKMVDYKDANNPYMYHCHFLEHEDAGMMGQFVVV